GGADHRADRGGHQRPQGPQGHGGARPAEGAAQRAVPRQAHLELLRRQREAAMSTWRVRHEGSPRSVDGLTLQQLGAGLADGQWERTEGGMGRRDTTGEAIENHPELAEIAAEIEPRPPRSYGDETHLDMNALIDVCLVLLIFFILTTTVAALQKRLQ